MLVLNFAACGDNDNAGQPNPDIIDSTQIVDPNIPVDSNTPVDPNIPVDPDTPVDPNIPVDPNTPVDPEIPVDPGPNQPFIRSFV
ncbi:MAG: hypothetical protein GX801_10600 [Fibrobacter sp.]|nr:hypothetical protein [Fibrobacter sp.]